MAALRRLTFLIYLTEKFATKTAKQRLEMFVWISPARNIANPADCMCARSKYCVIRLNNRRDKSTMPLGKCIFWSFTLRPFVHVAIECISQGKSAILKACRSVREVVNEKKQRFLYRAAGENHRLHWLCIISGVADIVASSSSRKPSVCWPRRGRLYAHS